MTRDRGSQGNPAASLVEDATWERLHECLAPGGASVGTLGGGSSNWLAGKSTKSLPEVSPNMCCAHEPVGVDIELSNPLAVTLQVSPPTLPNPVDPAKPGLALTRRPCHPFRNPPLSADSTSDHAAVAVCIWPR